MLASSSLTLINNYNNKVRYWCYDILSVTPWPHLGWCSWLTSPWPWHHDSWSCRNNSECYLKSRLHFWPHFNIHRVSTFNIIGWVHLTSSGEYFNIIGWVLLTSSGEYQSGLKLEIFLRRKVSKNSSVKDTIILSGFCSLFLFSLGCVGYVCSDNKLTY